MGTCCLAVLGHLITLLLGQGFLFLKKQYNLLMIVSLFVDSLVMDRRLPHPLQCYQVWLMGKDVTVGASQLYLRYLKWQNFESKLDSRLKKMDENTKVVESKCYITCLKYNGI